MNYRFGPFVVDLVDFDRFVTPRVTDLLISNDTYMYLVNGTSLRSKDAANFNMEFCVIKRPRLFL